MGTRREHGNVLLCVSGGHELSGAISAFDYSRVRFSIGSFKSQGSGGIQFLVRCEMAKIQNGQGDEMHQWEMRVLFAGLRSLICGHQKERKGRKNR